jgi:tetratricopeptide (TPR) repeat protein
MALAGNLRTLSLGEVFQTLARIQATGVLRLAAKGGGRDVVFDNGAIIGVAFRSGESKQALLKRLVLLGKLDVTSAASLSSGGGETQLVKAIVERGLVSADDVTAAYHQQALDELQSLATWDYADFVFEDAGPGQDVANQLLERYRKNSIKIDMSFLLVEAARRSDEWIRLRERVPDPTAVYSPTDDGHTGLEAMAKEYPASAVVPLFDGVRTVDDAVADSVATRFDVYSVLAELIDCRLVQRLEPDELLRNAEHLVESGEHDRAARLFRLLLAHSPGDGEIGGRLAACLEHLGDPTEAAASWAQISLQRLERGELDQAITDSRRAVELAPASPEARQALAKCLVQGGLTAEAVRNQRELAALYLGQGQLEDARGACLKLLDLEPTDEPARRELARLAAHGGPPPAQDTVVCVRCGRTNRRDAKTCEACSTSLVLPCLACGRAIAVSDRVCIFCGKEPHTPPSTTAPAPASTAQFIKTERVKPKTKEETEHWRDRLARVLRSAREHEAAGRLEAALEDWRELAKYQQDSSDLQARIRDLEVRVNAGFIEERIATGHQLRKGRRYWRAMAAYRAALRSMPPTDPRAEPLKAILATTARGHRRGLAVYVAAIVVIGCLGFLVLQPYLQLHAFRARADAARASVAGIEAQGASAIAPTADLVDELGAQAARIRGKSGDTARSIAAEVKSDFTTARANVARAELDAIGAAIDHGDLDAAATRLQAYAPLFGADERAKQVQVETERLQSARQTRLDRDLLVKEGPKRLAVAASREKARALAEALELYRSLAVSPDAKVSAPAKEAVARLEPALTLARAAMDRAAELETRDLHGADEAWVGLTDTATAWALAPELDRHRQGIAARLAAATADFAKLGAQASADDLAAFVTGHAGSPEAERASARLASLRQQATSRDQAIERYRSLMDAKKWAEAWQAARDLVAVHGRTLKPDEVAYPLVIETVPAGASVSVGGRTVGQTPYVLTYLPQDDGEVTIALAGWKPYAVRLHDAAKDWHLQATLVRLPRWRAELRHPAQALQPLAGGEVLVSQVDALSRIGRDGAVAWTRGFAAEDSEEARGRARHMPLPLPDGATAVAQPDRGLAVIGRDGGQVSTLATEHEIRGRPLLFTNEVFGPQQRLAVAAEILLAGPVGEEPARIPLPAPALAGPLAVAKDLDRVLVLVDLRGHLVGIEDSTRRAVWDLDLQASECGALLSLGDGSALALLDGSRLAAIHFAADGPTVAWSQSLPSAAAGDPLIVGDHLVVACGDQVVRMGLDGKPQPTLQLPARATACAAAGDDIAVGCQDGSLQLFRNGERVWATPLGAMATAMAFVGETVVVGTADGAVVALAP